jgi:hypothetical protein
MQNTYIETNIPITIQYHKGIEITHQLKFGVQNILLIINKNMIG